MAQLLHVTDLTKKATALYRAHFMDFFRILAWLLVPTILLSILPILPISKPGMKFLVILLTIVTSIVSLWLSVILIDLVATYNGKGPTIKVLEKASWGTTGRVVDFVLVSLLQGLVILLGIVLFVIPGIIFAVWFSFSRYALLVDGTSPGTQSLRTSKELVQGRFWQILWRWFGSYLYFGSFIALGTIIILAIIGALLGNPALAFGDVTPWWSDLFVSIISILVTPLFVTVGYLIYDDAKRSR